MQQGPCTQDVKGRVLVTHCKLSSNVEGDCSCHGNGHKCCNLGRQQVSQDADQDGSKEKANAHLDAVLWQGCNALQTLAQVVSDSASIRLLREHANDVYPGLSQARRT